MAAAHDNEQIQDQELFGTTNADIGPINFYRISNHPELESYYISKKLNYVYLS